MIGLSGATFTIYDTNGKVAGNKSMWRLVFSFFMCLTCLQLRVFITREARGRASAHGVMIVGSIPHSGLIKLFLFPVTEPQLVKQGSKEMF